MWTQGWRCFTTLAIGVMLGACLGCETAESATVAQPCNPNQFRACEHECGRGVQQCRDDGDGVAWSDCTCVTLDASLPEAGPAGGAGGTAGSPASVAGAAGRQAGGAGGASSAGAGGSP